MGICTGFHPWTVLVSTLISIVGIALIAVVLRSKGVKICPICTGVALTWLWELYALWFKGWGDHLLIAVLMGGSAVGFAYTFGKRIQNPNANMWWKIVMVPIGFVAVYGVISQNWIWAGVGALTGLVAILAFSAKKRPRSLSPTAKARLDSHEKARQALENKMDNCC